RHVRRRSRPARLRLSDGDTDPLETSRTAASDARSVMTRVLVFLSLLAFWPVAAPAAGDELAALKATLQQRLPRVSLDGLRPSKTVPGWYELEHGMQLLFISGDGKHLFLGDLIDLEAQTNLSEAWRERYARDRIEA